MTIKQALLAPLFLLAACGPAAEGEPVTVIEFGENGETITRKQGEDEAQAPAQPAAESACERLTFQETVLTHCIADPAKHRIATVLGPPASQLCRAGEVTQQRAGLRDERRHV